MKLVEQQEYRGYALLLFEEHVPDSGRPAQGHWLVIAPDGITILGDPRPTAADARALVDQLVDSHVVHSAHHT